MANETLAENTANKILEYIQRNHLGSGMKIPTEIQLSEMFSVSRTTVREAEKILHSRNVLEIKQGAGAFVSPKRGIVQDPLGFSTEHDRIQLMHDLMTLRINLEPFAAELAAIYATRDDLRRLWDIQDAMENTIPFETAEFEEADLNFHICIAHSTHNIAIRRIIPIVEEAFGNMARTRKAKMPCEQTLQTHLDILKAIEKHDAFEAKNKMIVHLMLAEKVADEGNGL